MVPIPTLPPKGCIDISQSAVPAPLVNCIPIEFPLSTSAKLKLPELSVTGFTVNTDSDIIVALSVALALLPETYKLADGLAVPIPTLPEPSIIILVDTAPPPAPELLNNILAVTFVASAFAVKTKSLPTFAKVAFCKLASALDITP